MMVYGACGRQGYRGLTSCQRHLRRTTRVACRLACIPDRSAASSSMHSIYKSQHPSSHFLCFSQKIHCQSESITCQRFVRSTHLPPTLIRSLFSSVSDFIRSIYFSFIFYSPYGKNLSFLHLSPLFILNPSVLSFVTTCRQCLVRQVTSRSSATGRVTRNCTRWVVEIQTN